MDSAGKTGTAIYCPPSRQHATAGPYSPVLEVKTKSIVVISGQAALDLKGNVNTTDFEEQSVITLTAAGCSFSDVFKVNVSLTDLSDWQKFNGIYEKMMQKPFPVRTAVQAGLLHDFLVEIEMWAAKPDA